MSQRMTNQTKKWIFESFAELVKDTNYKDISISMIMENAQLSRRTFYRFFKSKDDLLEKYFLQLFEKYFHDIQTKKFNSFSDLILEFFVFWDQYRKPLQAFQKQNLLIDSLRVYNEQVANNYKKSSLPWHDKELNSKQIAVITEFAVGGLWNIFINWGLEDTHTPKEMADEVIAGLKTMVWKN
ncbi:TetR/AcrR family transcriptional regulator [Bombilactobacillus bombi]|uniref:TetR/AcrR family transcriptional regulator n=1 Tax=Bombilactobacillus bombi TaxID=1303590 RepID=UPI0015E61EED|nr:TetR/AcrR family transcriptional regulator [Bombilactobacillus bombi]MBA1435166.1 TetR/AcrR family transcriptional regulator [Bombilactobacillus bombi]